MVGHRARRLLAKHVGIPGCAVPHAPQRGAGAQHHARCAVVPWCPGELCATGAAPCRACARCGHARHHWHQRARPAPRTVLARAASPSRRAGPAPASPRRGARRPGGRLPAQHPANHGGVFGRGLGGRGVERVCARHGHQRRARPLCPNHPHRVDRLRRRHLWRQRPSAHRRAVATARCLAQRAPHHFVPRVEHRRHPAGCLRLGRHRGPQRRRRGRL